MLLNYAILGKQKHASNLGCAEVASLFMGVNHIRKAMRFLWQLVAGRRFDATVSFVSIRSSH